LIRKSPMRTKASCRMHWSGPRGSASKARLANQRMSAKKWVNSRANLSPSGVPLLASTRLGQNSSIRRASSLSLRPSGELRYAAT
jgi:hypothetical protein